jgi:hypothetical protein
MIAAKLRHKDLGKEQFYFTQQLPACPRIIAEVFFLVVLLEGTGTFRYIGTDCTYVWYYSELRRSKIQK